MEYLLLFLMMIPPVALAVYRSHRGGGMAPIDLGVVFAGIVFLYAWLPLLGLVLAQHGYGVLQDKRVVDDMPTSAEIVAVGASYLVFLFGFALGYLGLLKPAKFSLAPVQGNRFQAVMITAVAALLILFNFLGERLLGAGQGESYIDSYAVRLNLPLVAQQILNELAQLGLVASLAAMVFIIAWRPRLHRYAALVVLIFLLDATFSGGSRTLGFLLAFGYLVCVSIYVRKIQPRHLVLLAAAGLMLFTVAGIIRSGIGFGAFMLAPFQGGEFFSVFINSIDLLRKSAEGGGIEVPWQLHWVDVLRFIPQQLLWFEKVDPSVWYVATYYPEFYDAGGGLAFGAIAESVVGLGNAGAFVKGVLLGVAFAFVANRCSSGPMTPLKAFVYVWFVVISYQAIRDTAFSVFPGFVFQVLPVIVFIVVSYRVMRLTARRDFTQVPTASGSGG